MARLLVRGTVLLMLLPLACATPPRTFPAGRGLASVARVASVMTPSELSLTQSVAATWGGRGGVRCASGRLLRGIAGSGLTSADALQQLDSLGGAFARVDSTVPGAADLVDALLTLPDNGILQLPVALMDGANVWLLQALNESLAPAGSPVWLWAVHAPNTIWQGGQVTQDVLNSYLLNTLGFDCVLDVSLESSSSAASFALLHPHQAYGYTVVARAPEAVTIDAAARLWTWVKPFSGGTWGVIVSMFFASAALMQWYEGAGAKGEYAKFNRAGAPQAGKRSQHVSKFAYGVYLSFSSFATNNSQTFTAKTLPGRIYRTAYAFVILLTGSCYIANLAAVLSYTPPPVAEITSISSFEQLDLPACVLNNSLHIAFMQAQYPNTKLSILSNVGNGAGGDVNTEQTERDLLAALVASDAPCMGGIAPDDSLSFWLGPVGDPDGEFCNLRIVGQPLSQGLVGLVMSPNTSAVQLAALNGAVVAELASGRYADAMIAFNNFPTLRSSCSASTAAASGAPQSLGLADFSGIFLVLAFGALVSVVVKLGLLAAPHGLAPGSFLMHLTHRALDNDPHSAGNAEKAVCGLPASDVQSPGAVAEAMAAHALSLVVVRNAASALAESGAALEAALAQAAQDAADGALTKAAGAAVVGPNAA